MLGESAMRYLPILFALILDGCGAPMAASPHVTAQSSSAASNPPSNPVAVILGQDKPTNFQFAFKTDPDGNMYVVPGIASKIAAFSGCTPKACLQQNRTVPNTEGFLAGFVVTEVGNPPAPALVRFVSARSTGGSPGNPPDPDPIFSIALNANETRSGLLPDIENTWGINITVVRGTVDVSLFLHKYKNIN
jgi:hypothetical protein